MSRVNIENDNQSRAERAKERKKFFEREILELTLGIRHGWAPTSDEYWTGGGHMITDQFEATLNQGRRIAECEDLLHGEHVLIYSAHAKSLGALVARLMRLVNFLKHEECPDSVLEQLLIRILQSQGESFEVTALALIRIVSKPHLSLVVTPMC